MEGSMSTKQDGKVVPIAPSSEPYVVTADERASVQAFIDNRKRAAPGLKVKIENGATTILPDHPDRTVGLVRLMESVGAKNMRFYEEFQRQLCNVGMQPNTSDDVGVNFMLSVVQGIEPRDQVETMLGAQMAAIHMATMSFARRLSHVTTIAQQDSAERALNKLARTFTTQMEALKRYRSTGEQKMTVEHQHVTVNEGGQAIVGNVTTGGGGIKNLGEQPHGPALTHAPGETLPGHVEAVREEVLRSGG
jgi:hypothetical protein